MATTTQIDCRLTAEKNDLQVLRELHQFGWLTTRQIARLVWPGMKQSKRMAQRTLSRLIKARMVVLRELKYNVRAYVLSVKGAAFLRKNGVTNAYSRGGTGLSLEKPYHRAISNDYMIDKKLEIAKSVGNHLMGIFTEHEIQRQLSPRLTHPQNDSLFLPDGLTFQGGDYSWIEVENASKSPSRLDHIIKFANIVLTTSREQKWQYGDLTYKGEVDGSIQAFLILCPNESSFRACLRAIERHGIAKFSDNAFLYLSVGKVDMTPALKWGGITKQWSVSELLDEGLIKEEPNEPEPTNLLLQKSDE